MILGVQKVTERNLTY